MTLPADLIPFFTATDTSGDGTPSISPMIISSSTTSAGYRLKSTGDIHTYEDGGSFADVGDWIAPKIGMANFRARATLMVGAVSAGSSPLNTWIPLSGDATWQRIAGVNDAQTQLWIEIGPAGGTTVTSALITLNVTGTGDTGGGGDPPGGGSGQQPPEIP